MDPETPVNEADRQNVSLTCEVVTGNPASLTAVRWYLDGDLLKELPDCTRNSSSTTTTTEESLIFCDIDPSKLLLEAVGRSFHGNYSCEGRNDAGWGPLSPSAPVMVYCEPPLFLIFKSMANSFLSLFLFLSARDEIYLVIIVIILEAYCDKFAYKLLIFLLAFNASNVLFSSITTVFVT